MPPSAEETCRRELETADLERLSYATRIQAFFAEKVRSAIVGGAPLVVVGRLVLQAREELRDLVIRNPRSVLSQGRSRLSIIAVDQFLYQAEQRDNLLRSVLSPWRTGANEWSVEGEFDHPWTWPMRCLLAPCLIEVSDTRNGQNLQVMVRAKKGAPAVFSVVGDASVSFWAKRWMKGFVEAPKPRDVLRMMEIDPQERANGVYGSTLTSLGSLRELESLSLLSVRQEHGVRMNWLFW